MNTKQNIQENDNTRVNKPTPVFRLEGIPERPIPVKYPSGEIYDKDLIDAIKRQRNINEDINNFWNYGAYWPLNPYTPEGQRAIRSATEYASGNVQRMGEVLITTGIGEGVGLAIKLATTSKVIPTNATHVTKIKSSPISRTVTKYSTKSPAALHYEEAAIDKSLRARSKYLGTNPEGLAVYKLTKLKPITELTLSKRIPEVDKAMARSGYHRVHDPAIPDLVYTNGKDYIGDLKAANFGLTKVLKRLKILDSARLTKPEFEFVYLKRGGRLINKN